MICVWTMPQALLEELNALSGDESCHAADSGEAPDAEGPVPQSGAPDGQRQRCVTGSQRQQATADGAVTESQLAGEVSDANNPSGIAEGSTDAMSFPHQQRHRSGSGRHGAGLLDVPADVLMMVLVHLEPRDWCALH